MEDTFLDGIFLGMRLRSDEILIGTARGVIKTRTLRRRVEEEQWDPEFAKSIKGEPRQPVPGINSDHVPAAISDRAGVHLEEDQPDTRLAQQAENKHVWMQGNKSNPLHQATNVLCQRNGIAHQRNSGEWVKRM